MNYDRYLRRHQDHDLLLLALLCLGLNVAVLGGLLISMLVSR